MGCMLCDLIMHNTGHACVNSKLAHIWNAHTIHIPKVRIWGLWHHVHSLNGYRKHMYTSTIFNVVCISILMPVNPFFLAVKDLGMKHWQHQVDKWWLARKASMGSSPLLMILDIIIGACHIWWTVFHLGSSVIQIKFSYSFLMLDLMCVHRYRVIYRLVNTVYVLGITSADLDDVDSNIFACACMVNQAVRSLFVLPLHPVFLVGLRGNPLPFSQYHCDLPKNKECSW